MPVAIAKTIRGVRGVRHRMMRMMMIHADRLIALAPASAAYPKSLSASAAAERVLYSVRDSSLCAYPRRPAAQ
jgi:hypothetical protein